MEFTNNVVFLLFWIIITTDLDGGLSEKDQARNGIPTFFKGITMSTTKVGVRNDLTNQLDPNYIDYVYDYIDSYGNDVDIMIGPNIRAPSINTNQYI